MASCAIGISIFRQPEHWVQASVRSALEQTASNIQVIVRIDGDDGVEAEVRKWLDEQSALDNRLQVIYSNQQLGNFGSLYEIFANTNADYLIQLDADDMLHPQAADLAIDKLEGNPNISFVYTDCLEIDANDKIIGPGSRQSFPYTYNGMLAQFITFHMRCIRRTFYEAVGGYRVGFPHCGDYDLSLRLAEAGDVGHIPLPLYFYRVHDANTSTIKNKETMIEGFSVARNALYRRGLAHRYYLKCSYSGSVCLIDWKERQASFAEQVNQSVDIKSLFDVWLL